LDQQPGSAGAARRRKTWRARGCAREQNVAGAQAARARPPGGHVTGQGIGLGLRHALAKGLFESAPRCVRWLEIHPENYLSRGGRYESMLATARARWPLLTHGLTLGFGALAPFDAAFLKALRGFLRELGAPFHSDHLCFSGVDGLFAHDLLP